MQTPEHSIFDVVVLASVAVEKSVLSQSLFSEYKEKYLQKMEEFQKRYTRICREHHLYPLEVILNHIRRCSEGNLSSEDMTKLDLSSFNLTPEDCNAFADTLTDDLFFEELSFSDCLPSEESSKILLRGLMENKAVKRLNLKGKEIELQEEIPKTRTANM